MSDTINRRRRDFLGLGVLAAAGWRQAFAVSDPANAQTPPLSELAYGQVRFRAGPLERQARENHALVLGLDEDALLRPFRVIRRDSLLRAQRDRNGRHEWQVATTAGAVNLKPFLDIDTENYSVYQSVLPS